MAVSSGTQSVTLRDGVNIWDKDVTVDQLFTGDVKGRVLLDKLFELYQATVKTQNNKPPSNLVILWSCIAVQCSNDFAHNDSTYLLLIWMIFRHIHNHWRVWHGQWVCLAIFDSTCSIMLRWNSVIFENKTWFNSSLPGRCCPPYSYSYPVWMASPDPAFQVGEGKKTLRFFQDGTDNNPNIPFSEKPKNLGRHMIYNPRNQAGVKQAYVRSVKCGQWRRRRCRMAAKAHIFSWVVRL